MAVPFRVGVMQLTMEPLDEMLASARAMDEAGMDTIWLAEAYPWWRKHQMEARSSTVVSALMARETTRLTIGWGIISPWTRHPVQVAMDARVVQEAAGPDRFLLGFGTSKIFLNNIKGQTKKTLGPMRDAVEIVRGVLSGEAFSYDGDTWSADVPALSPEAHTPRGVPPVYVAATAPKMQALAGEIADGCLTPSITTPAFVRYTCENVAADVDIGCTVVASIHATDRDAGRDGAREIAGMYLANKVQNIAGAADTLLELAGIEMDEIRPVAEAMEQGGRLAAKAKVSDALLDKCRPIAGTPADCIAAIEEYRDAGCTHVMLELWGEDRHEQIRLFGSRCCPTSVREPVRRRRVRRFRSRGLGAAGLPLRGRSRPRDGQVSGPASRRRRRRPGDAPSSTSPPGRVTSRRALPRAGRGGGRRSLGAMIERSHAGKPRGRVRGRGRDGAAVRRRELRRQRRGVLLLHLARPERVAAEALRVLEPGGRAAATVWDHPSRSRWLGVLFDAIAAAGTTAPADLPEGPPIFRFADEGPFFACSRKQVSSRSPSSVWVRPRARQRRRAVAGAHRRHRARPPLVRAQPEPTQRAIRERFDELLGEHRGEDGLAVPVAATIGIGRRP